MANFCTQCGAEAGSGTFCIRCGHPLTSAPPPAPQPVRAATPPAAAPGVVPAAVVVPAKSGSALKAILITLMLLAVLAVAGVVGSIFYIRNRVHAGLAHLKQRGIDIPAAMDSASHSVASGEVRDGCLLLSRDDAQAILGVALTRAEGRNGASSEEHCDYYPAPGASAAARDATAARFNALKNGQRNSAADLSKIEDLVKGMGASVNDGAAPILEITVYRGNAQMATSAFNAAGALMGTKMESVPGPWDQAIFGPLNSTLTVRKGDNGVMIDLRQIPRGRQKGLELAKTIVPRL